MIRERDRSKKATMENKLESAGIREEKTRGQRKKDR